ncbi:MAG: S9 family peptidase, partial [Acidobacteria bacterium]|nr:S9 family peptidase [Acidobacteriota bacterium]
AILTSALRRPDPEYDTDGNDIFAVAVEDGASRQLTSRKGPDNNPTVSPDGRFIAYTGFDDKGLGYTVTRLYVMAIDGSNPKLLAGEWDRDVANPRWAADSTGIYFTSGDRGSTNLHFVSLGGAVRPVTEERQQLTGVDLGPGGRVVAVRSTPKEPGDIVTFTVQQPLRTTRLTGVNDSLLATLRLGDVEEIWYKSFDGRDVQGWIVKPPGFDPSRKYPLILYIHGGPHMMYGVEFDHEFQTHAALDYVLLYTNPRGSTGYGQEFGNIIQYDYPGENLKDLMAGVDAVVARGYVDPKRMVITGGSGGGLMTAWTVTQTDRFAAAAAQYPSINWFTLVLTSDSAYQGLKRRFKKWMWEDPDEYLKRSPIRHAGNVRTPTLLITGEADWRTPISQSEEFYRALKLRKVDTLLVRVPDEPHGIGAGSSNHITHRMAKVLYLMEWFDKYTKPSGPVTSAKDAVER